MTYQIARCRTITGCRACELLDQPRWEFGRLWDNTVPKGRLDRDGWAANPEVWVIRFEVCEKPDGWPG